MFWLVWILWGRLRVWFGRRSRYEAMLRSRSSSLPTCLSPAYRECIDGVEVVRALLKLDGGVC